MLIDIYTPDFIKECNKRSNEELTSAEEILKNIKEKHPQLNHLQTEVNYNLVFPIYHASLCTSYPCTTMALSGDTGHKCSHAPQPIHNDSLTTGIKTVSFSGFTAVIAMA